MSTSAYGQGFNLNPQAEITTLGQPVVSNRDASYGLIFSKNSDYAVLFNQARTQTRDALSTWIK